MIDLMMYLAALFMGVVLGTGYFWALWLTVRRLPAARHPGLLMLVSYLVRQAICGTVFVLLAYGGHWEWLMFALFGFLLMRRLLVRSVRESFRGSRPTVPGGLME